MRNWFSHVLHRTRANPHKPAMVMEDRVVTYQMLHDGIERCARRMATLGLADAEQVAVVVSNPIRHMILCLALFRIAVRGVSIEHAQAGIASLKFSAVLGDVEAKSAVDPANRFIEVDDGWFTADLPSPYPLPEPFADPEDIFRMSFTSGSTGVPKVVPRSVEGTNDLILKFLDINWSVVLALPGLSVHWSYMTACAALATGRTVCFAETPFQAVRMISLFSIDFVIASTEQLLALTRVARKTEARLPSLRTIMIAGTVPTRALLEAASVHLCNNILSRYGAAEMGAIADVPVREVLSNPGLVGRPFPEVEIKVLDRTGQPCALGEVGVIHARQSGAARWVNLDDAGWLSADGRLFVVGRASETAAFVPQISPELEIEQLVRLEWDLVDVGAVKIGEGGNERIVVAVVGNHLVTADAVAPMLKAHGIQASVEVVHLDAVPRAASGKLNRGDLKSLVEMRS